MQAHRLPFVTGHNFHPLVSPPPRLLIRIGHSPSSLRALAKQPSPTVPAPHPHAHRPGSCYSRELPPHFKVTIMKTPVVYIMASQRNGTLYTGMTTDLIARARHHREALTPSFTTKYHCKLLVWYECRETIPDALAREHQIKAGSRRAKLALIEAQNPDWRDLSPDLL